MFSVSCSWFTFASPEKLQQSQLNLNIFNVADAARSNALASLYSSFARGDSAAASGRRYGVAGGHTIGRPDRLRGASPRQGGPDLLLLEEPVGSLLKNEELVPMQDREDTTEAASRLTRSGRSEGAGTESVA